MAIYDKAEVDCENESDEDSDTELAGEDDALPLRTVEISTASEKREFLKSRVLNFNDHA